MDVPPPDPHQIDGYLVVLSATACAARWRTESERASGKDGGQAAKPWSALPEIVPGRYQGICRSPIDRWWEGEPSVGVASRNEPARRRIWERYGPDPSLHWEQPPWFDPDLLPEIGVAREILSLADDRDDRELVRVTRETAEVTRETLGFDVGYWGSDHFSVIADAMVMPRWHGCPPGRLESLRPWAAALNDALLFPSAAAAAGYREWYLAQGWGEEEGSPGKFQVVRVDRAS